MPRTLASKHPSSALKPRSALKTIPPDIVDIDCGSEKVEQLHSALNISKGLAERYKQDRQDALAALKKKNKQVDELKTYATVEKEKYKALLNQYEERERNLTSTLQKSPVEASSLPKHGVTKQGGGDTSDDLHDLDRLRASVETLEIRNGILREEKISLSTLLNKREATCTSLREELAAVARREGQLREDMSSLRADAEASGARAGSLVETNVTLELESAGLRSQVEGLEAQLNVAASSVIQHREAEEAALRREKELKDKVAALQDDYNCLHRKSTADLGDWRKRYKEAVSTRKVVEARLQRVLEMESRMIQFSERQALCGEALRGACELLAEKSSSLAASVRQGGCHARERGIRKEGEDSIPDGVQAHPTSTEARESD
ncbi:unnamed protein product, partial [Discosporangium mesarthrocarpum]